MEKPPVPSQQNIMYHEHFNIAERDRAFMELLKGADPLTRAEVDELIRRRPERYLRYRGFGTK